jgi:hypothetical protein
MKHIYLPITGLLAITLLMTACGGKISSQAGQQCSREVHLANQELEDAKVKGLSGTVQWTKAAGLITAANAKMQLEKFESCIDKAQRARTYLREAGK